MKVFKKILSVFLTMAIMLGMICVGAVSAGAASSSKMYIESETTSYGHKINIHGISREDIYEAIKIAKKDNVEWGIHAIFENNDVGYTYSLWAYSFDYSDFSLNTITMDIMMKLDIVSNKRNVNLTGFTPLYYEIIDMLGSDCSLAYVFNEGDSVYDDLMKCESVAAAVYVYDLDEKDYRAIDKYQKMTPSWIKNSSSDSDSSSKNISSLSITKPSNKTYTGKNRKAAVTIKDGSKTLEKGKDYTLSYKNCKEIGTATVTIKGKGNYTGTKTLTYKIVPKKTTLKVAKSSDTKAKFTWTAVDGAEKYQIYYSTNGGKYKKLATVSGSKTSYTSTKLDFKKNDYKFKIRSYATSDDAKYYSSYSKAVAVK